MSIGHLKDTGVYLWTFTHGDTKRVACEFTDAEDGRAMVFADEVAAFRETSPEIVTLLLKSGSIVRVAHTYGVVCRALGMEPVRYTQAITEEIG